MGTGNINTDAIQKKEINAIISIRPYAAGDHLDYNRPSSTPPRGERSQTENRATDKSQRSPSFVTKTP